MNIKILLKIQNNVILLKWIVNKIHWNYKPGYFQSVKLICCLKKYVRKKKKKHCSDRKQCLQHSFKFHLIVILAIRNSVSEERILP